MTFDILIVLDTCNAFLFDCFYCLSIALHVVVFFLLTMYLYSFIQLLAASLFIKFSVQCSVE